MLILGIETTGPISSVALYIDGKIKEIENLDSYSHLKELMPMVSKLLSDSNVKGEDLDAIAISKGPGSFTGIRIGMVSAKALALIWNKRLIEVPTLSCFSFKDYESLKGYDNLVFVPVIDAKMQEVYAGAFRKNDLDGIIVANVYKIEEFLESLTKNTNSEDKIVFLGDGIEKYKDDISRYFKSAVFLDKDDWYPRAYQMMSAAKILYEKGEFTDCYKASPEYFRLPEAERQRKLKEEQNAKKG